MRTRAVVWKVFVGTERAGRTAQMLLWAFLVTSLAVELNSVGGSQHGQQQQQQQQQQAASPTSGSGAHQHHLLHQQQQHKTGNPHRHTRHTNRHRHKSARSAGKHLQHHGSSHGDDNFFRPPWSATSAVHDDDGGGGGGGTAMMPLLASAPAASPPGANNNNNNNGRIVFEPPPSDPTAGNFEPSLLAATANGGLVVQDPSSSARNLSSAAPVKPRYGKPPPSSSSPFAPSSSSSSSPIRWHKVSSSMMQQAPFVNCSWCANHEQLARLRLGMIKQRILTRLGYGAALPDASYKDIPKNSPLQKLIEDFSMQADSPAFGLRPGDVSFQQHQEDEDGDAQIQGIYVLAQPLPDEKMSPLTENLNVQYFSFSKPLMRNKISDAWLWLFMKADKSPEEGTREIDPPQDVSDSSQHQQPSVNSIPQPQRTVPVYRVPRPRVGRAFDSPILTLVGNVTRPRRNAWVRLNVRHLVQDWFRDPSSNYGVIVGGPGEPEVCSVVARASNATVGEDGRIPYLEIEVSQQGRRSRMKRNAGMDCDDSLRSKNLCCRHPLVVDFETIGWDWIIAPRSYHAFHCAGYCEPMHIPEYQHTYVLGHKQIVEGDINGGGHDPRSMYGNKPPPVACCAPKKLSALSLLHFTPDSEIIVSKVPEMITDSCTCA